jgi:Cu-Zn family superoxide dismutase
MRPIVLFLALLPLAACGRHELATGTPVAEGRLAVATMVDTAGRPVGRATVREVAGGLRVTLDARGLPAGTHGAHLHTVGRCDAPDFATASAHWNPSAAKHGSMNPQGPHAGDLPNIIIGKDGRGTLGTTLAGATFDGLVDADGATMMVHAATDDYQTDPSGNSGARVACGVFQPA